MLTVPDSTGNGYAGLLSTTNIREVIPAFLKDVDGSWYGMVRVPQDYVSTPKLIPRILANATTGVTRINVYTSVKGDADVVDAALTAETAQDITVPGTAYTLKDVTFSLSTTPVAGKTLTLRIQHDGTHVNDTLAVDTLLYEAVFQYANV